jgi:hypothetical protein
MSSVMRIATIKLHLKEHCIETAAKKELNNITYLYFNTNKNPDILLKKIELLQAFIKQSNFPELRSSDERLSGIKEAFVRISMEENNKIILEFEK